MNKTQIAEIFAWIRSLCTHPKTVTSFLTTAHHTWTSLCSNGFDESKQGLPSEYSIRESNRTFYEQRPYQAFVHTYFSITNRCVGMTTVTLMCRLSRYSWSLNFLGPWGPVQASIGIPLTLTGVAARVSLSGTSNSEPTTHNVISINQSHTLNLLCNSHLKSSLFNHFRSLYWITQF